MDKQQMEQQFLSRYDSIIQSGDTRQMERLGALESYDVVMIRMRWSDSRSRNLDKDCRLTAEGKTYQILQLQDDRRENIVQIIAQETNEQLGKEQ